MTTKLNIVEEVENNNNNNENNIIEIKQDKKIKKKRTRKVNTEKIYKQKIPDDFAYCMKCRKGVEVKDKNIETKNNRRSMKGFCNICNCKVFKFIKKE